MAPDLILVVAGLSAAWAVFSIIGGERQRVLQNADAHRDNQAADDSPSSKRTTHAAVPAGKSSK